MRNTARRARSLVARAVPPAKTTPESADARPPFSTLTDCTAVPYTSQGSLLSLSLPLAPSPSFFLLLSPRPSPSQLLIVAWCAISSYSRGIPFLSFLGPRLPNFKSLCHHCLERAAEGAAWMSLLSRFRVGRTLSFGRELVVTLVLDIVASVSFARGNGMDVMASSWPARPFCCGDVRSRFRAVRTRLLVSDRLSLRGRRGRLFGLRR